MRVRIDGREFANVNEAARFYGKAPGTIYSAIHDGDPDRVARVPRWNPARSQPVTIGPLTFSSMAEASRALGFKNREFVSKALKHRSKRGMQRILAAAMKLAAKREAQEGE